MGTGAGSAPAQLSPATLGSSSTRSCTGFQVGEEANREEEMKPSNVARRVRAMLGEDVEFTFEWISLYRFQSRRLERFRHGRVLFAGDAAHQMSPFGARGGNSGVQDADNLAWKLDLVLQGLARERLLDSYDWERVQAADENLLQRLEDEGVVKALFDFLVEAG